MISEKAADVDSRGCRQESYLSTTHRQKREKKEFPHDTKFAHVAALSAIWRVCGRNEPICRLHRRMRSADCENCDERSRRFVGKVENIPPRCRRGGKKAVDLRSQPWIDWQNTGLRGDAASKAPGLSGASFNPQ